MVHTPPDTRESMAHRLRKANATIFILMLICLVQFTIIMRRAQQQAAGAAAQEATRGTR